MKRFFRISAVLLLLLLLCFGVAWAWGSYKNYKKVRDLKLQMAALAPEPDRRGPPEGMREIFDQARELPSAYRQEFFYEMRAEREAREKERLKAYFDMSKEDRMKALDKQIAEEEKRNKEREAARKKREAERAASGQQNQNGSSRGGQGNNSNDAGSNGQGNGAGPGGPGGGPGGPFGRGGTLASRLDRSDPEMRAMQGAQRIENAQRRAQLGLPPARNTRTRI